MKLPRHRVLGHLGADLTFVCVCVQGPCVRYSPNYVLFNTTEAFKDIYSHSKNVQKSQAYLAMVHNTPSTFTLMDRHEHAWKKRILSQKLSDAAIRSFEPNIAEIVERFCAVLRPASEAGKNAWSEPFNMSEWSTLGERDDDDVLCILPSPPPPPPPFVLLHRLLLC